MTGQTKQVGKWEKSSQTLIDNFAKALPVDTSVEYRKMFGYPCAFVNGNMFCGLHQQDVIVRLGAEEVLARIAAGDGEAFSPMAGRTMREYLALPEADRTDVARLRRWLKLGFNHTKALPGKAPKRR